MNRAEHIRQVLAVAASHQVIVDHMFDAPPGSGSSVHHLAHLLQVERVGFACHVIAQQMADDQARCEQFAVAFWHRVFHRNLREHGER
jgi:hypothetical protein